MQTSTADAKTTVTVALGDIVRNPKFQVRAKLNSGAVTQYATILRNGGKMEPVQLADVRGALVLIDGWHRVAAHEKLQRFDIEAVVIQAAGKDVPWLAAQANLKHGVRLKPRELKSVWQAYIRSGKYLKASGRLKSYREWAVDLGNTVNHTTLYRWTQKHHPKLAAMMGGTEPRVTGGLREADPRDSLASAAVKALENARAAFRGVRDEEDRALVLQVARETLAAMEADTGESWEPLTPDF